MRNGQAVAKGANNGKSEAILHVTYTDLSITSVLRDCMVDAGVAMVRGMGPASPADADVAQPH